MSQKTNKKRDYLNPNLFQAEVNLTQGSGNTDTVSIMCPHCRQLGSFGKAVNNYLTYSKRTENNTLAAFSASIRICPNTNCNGLVFVILEGGAVAQVEPPQLLNFSLDNLPVICQETLKEAIACHAAGAYRAAVMMVRRLLEEICELNEAKGDNLHKRLEALQGKVILPKALFDAMGELKALGNDAAHVEAKAYDNIGSEEAEDSILLAQEILKALYQLQGIVGRLQSRKKTG
jgi:hypothetical protein